MVTLDGSDGEGGGQILRSALTMAALTGTPFAIDRIRANRDKPGLRPQHRTCVLAAAAICGARTEGAEIGSSRLVFEPGPVRAGTYRFDIGTAGAVSLVLQTVALPLAVNGGAGSTVTVTGGTHVPHSPSFHELDGGWRVALERIGVDVRLDLRRLGFYPRGGGEVVATIQPRAKLRGVRWSQPADATTARALSVVAGLPGHVNDRQAGQLRKRLLAEGFRVTLETHDVGNAGPGTVAVVTLDAGPVPAVFAAIGERGKPAERVADKAAERAVRFRERGAPIDLHLADQIAVPLAIANGPSEYATTDVTEHLRTNLGVLSRFIDRPMEVDELPDATGVVRIG